jgi:hypothetical protein
MAVEHVHATWLFTRGHESVRVERISLVRNMLRLVVSGPGHEHDEQDFDDATECTSRQSSFERRLTALGFHLEDFSDRRRQPDRRSTRRGRDRRRH